MSYNVLLSSHFKREFKREFKRLAGKFISLKPDFEELTASLKENPVQGISLGNDCYKIRLAIRSKGKGKSEGARLITCVKIIEKTVYLITIYDKSELGNISDKELSSILKEEGLL